MSYEKKMKDLMARLVSMSPEPPPYPEEIPMARPESRKTARPALAFAVAAVLVAILAVPLLLFTGDEGDPDVLATTTSTTIPVTSTTLVEATSTTISPSTTTTVPTPDSWSGVVFLYQEPENSFIGSPALVPVAVTIEGLTVFQEEVDFFQALATLAQTVEELPPGLQTAVPSDVFPKSKRLDGDIAVADMNEAFLDGGGGALADFIMLNQLIYTLTDDEAQSVLFTVDGAPVEQFGSEGLDLTTPVRRDEFLEHVHSINLTSPIIEQDGRYLVEGIANVFEGALTVRVLNENREVVHEAPVQATSGSGTWGEFSTEIDSALIVPGQTSIQVFTYSAEDGSDTNVITVPIPEGDVWRFTAGS